LYSVLPGTCAISFVKSDFLPGTNGRLLLRELAFIGVEGDRALGIAVLKSFGLRESEGDLCGGVIEGVFLDGLMGGEGNFIHGLYFIMKIITFAAF
jgi:hypothetical protein